MGYIDLVLSLRHCEAHIYSVEALLRRGADTGDIHLTPTELPRIRIDFDVLRALQNNTRDYGLALRDMLFTPVIRESYFLARGHATGDNAPLRVCLRLDAAHAPLHGIHWEKIFDPQGESFLFTSQHVIVSRYLDSADHTITRPRPQHQLSALVVVANPTNLTAYRLQPIEVAEEVARITTALERLLITQRLIARELNGQPATMANMLAALGDQPDILYLVCHGSTLYNEHFLWLEDERGEVNRIEGKAFAERIAALSYRPLLAILVSCESTTSPYDEGA